MSFAINTETEIVVFIILPLITTMFHIKTCSKTKVVQFKFIFSCIIDIELHV